MSHLYYELYSQVCNQLQSCNLVKMIKISQARNKQKAYKQKLLETKFKRIWQEFSSVDFQLTDENCSFQINNNIVAKDNFVAVQAKVQPTIGLYANIQFLITLFIDDNDQMIKPPKIYNDRRIFHPNINPYTCQIALPEIINWNPTYTLVYILRRTKYTLVEPNNQSIPNNPICKKAAFFCKVDRENYRNYVIQYCPAVLDRIVEKQMTNSSTDSQMQDENSQQQSQFIEISSILPMSRLDNIPKQKQKKEEEQKEDNNNDDNQQFEFLNKRFSHLQIQDQEHGEEDKENKQLHSAMNIFTELQQNQD